MSSYFCSFKPITKEETATASQSTTTDSATLSSLLMELQQLREATNAALAEGRMGKTKKVERGEGERSHEGEVGGFRVERYMFF